MTTLRQAQLDGKIAYKNLENIFTLTQQCPTVKLTNLTNDRLVSTNSFSDLTSVLNFSNWFTSSTLDITDNPNGTVNLETHGSATSKWDETLTVLTPKTTDGSVKVTSEFLIEKSTLGAECLFKSKNISVQPQEWHFGLGNALGYQVKDITNNKLPFFISPNSPNNSLFVNNLGFIGFGTSIFDAFTKFKISHSGAHLFSILTSGLIQTKITNYENLVTNGNDIPNKQYVDNTIPSTYWDRSSGSLYSKFITDKLGIGIATPTEEVQVHNPATIVQPSLMQFTNVTTTSAAGKGLRIGVSATGRGLCISENRYDFQIGAPAVNVGSILSNGKFNWSTNVIYYTSTSHALIASDYDLVDKKWVEDHTSGNTYWDRDGTEHWLSPADTDDGLQVFTDVQFSNCLFTLTSFVNNDIQYNVENDTGYTPFVGIVEAFDDYSNSIAIAKLKGTTFTTLHAESPINFTNVAGKNTANSINIYYESDKLYVKSTISGQTIEIYLSFRAFRAGAI